MEQQNVLYHTEEGYVVQLDMTNATTYSVTYDEAALEEEPAECAVEDVEVKNETPSQPPWVLEIENSEAEQLITMNKMDTSETQDEDCVVLKPEVIDNDVKVEPTPSIDYDLEVINDYMRMFRCKKCPKYYYDLTSFVNHFIIHSDSAFVCNICDERFPQKFTLKKHIYSHHLDLKPYQCDKCVKTFVRNSQLIRHKKIAHNVHGIPCNVCHKLFKSLFLMNIHKNSHREQAFPCEFCGKLFLNWNKHALHIEREHSTKDIRNFKCKICDKSYARAGSLSTHLRTHTERAYTCNFCKRAFMAKYALSEHIITVHCRSKPYKCRYCKERFGQKTGRTIHERKHTGKNMITCKVCSKTFTVRTRYKAHVRTHLSVRPHKCPHCFMRSTDRSNLEKHILRKHTVPQDGNALICAICDERFWDKDKIACHMMVHTGVHPFQCEMCDKAFNNNRTLTSHVRRHFLPEPAHYYCGICDKTCRDKKYHMLMHNNEKPFKCLVCEKSFRSRHYLDLHNRMHTGEKPYQCEKCSKTFSFRSNLNAHLKMHSGEKHYICYKCGKGFPYQSGLRRHIVAEVCVKKDKVDILIPTLLRPKTLSNPHLNPVDPNKTIYECSRCQKEFYHKSSFNRHNKVCLIRYDINALQNGETVNNFKCETCGRCYKNRSSLSMHRRMHLKKFITCGICSKPFIRKSHYREHMMSKHSVVKPFTCRYCKLSFHLKHILQRHIRKAHGEGADTNNFDTFIEEGNSYAYDLTTEIISNFLDNDSNKPFKCKTCGRSYKSKASYDKHQTMHNGKSLCCNLCGKVFKHKRSLDEHEQKEHKPVVQEQVHLLLNEPERKLKCMYCDLAFSTKEDWDHHMETHWSISTGSGAIYATNSTIHNDHIQTAAIQVAPSSLDNTTMQTVPMHDTISIHSPIEVSSTIQSPIETNMLQSTALQPVHVSTSLQDGIPTYTYSTFQPNKLPAYTIQRAYCNWDDPSDDNLAGNAINVTYEAIPFEEPDHLSLDDQPTDVIFVIDGNEQPVPEVKRDLKLEKIKPFKCDECNKSYSNEKNWKNHKAVHSGEAIDCVFCGKAFSPKMLKSHVKSVHMVVKMLKCPICEQFFLKKRFLDEHMKSHPDTESADEEDDTTEVPVRRMIGPDGMITMPVPRKKSLKKAKLVIEKPYKCFDCGKSYFTRTSLSTHRRVHTGKALCCVFCPKQFIKKHQLKDHVTAVHMKVKSYPCNVCHETYSRKISLLKHLRSHEPKPELAPGEVPVKPFKCTDCPKAFGSKNYLQEHMKLHTGQGISCEVCCKVFTKEKAVREHIMAVHIHMKPFKCDFCDKSFTQKSNFNLHRRKHTGEKLSKCTYCPKTFTSQAPLRRHLRFHTGQKPFPCTLCSKTFGDPSNLKKHLAVHTGEKRFHCANCDIGFNARTSLNRHMEMHKREVVQELFKCKECDETFTYPSRFEAHRRLHVNSKKPYQCATCGRGFVNKSSIESHVKVHLGLNTIVCAICNKSFSTKAQITAHMRVHIRKISGRRR